MLTVFPGLIQAQFLFACRVVDSMRWVWMESVSQPGGPVCMEWFARGCLFQFYDLPWGHP